MKVEPWMKALAKEEGFFGKCAKHVAGDRSYNLFCVKCLTKVSSCCQAAHKGHTLLMVSDTRCRRSFSDSFSDAPFNKRRSSELPAKTPSHCATSSPSWTAATSR